MKSVQQADGCVCIARKNCANTNENVPTERARGHVCVIAVTMTSKSNDWC